jgi:hypothetical protein
MESTVVLLTKTASPEFHPKEIQENYQNGEKNSSIAQQAVEQQHHEYPAFA